MLNLIHNNIDLVSKRTLKNSSHVSLPEPLVDVVFVVIDPLNEADGKLARKLLSKKKMKVLRM